MLSIHNLVVNRGKTFSVSLPSLELAQGEVVALCGISGCGKSTLLEAIGLILMPSHIQTYRLEEVGDITPLLQQQEQHHLAQLRAQYLGFMLQTGGLLPFLKVKDNIALPNQILQKPIDQLWIDKLIKSLGIQSLQEAYPHQLSIGERQRVAFVRAVAHKPALLLADEPTAALDPYHADKLFDLILGVVRDESIATIIVTHDWDTVQQRNIKTFKAQLAQGSTVFVQEKSV